MNSNFDIASITDEALNDFRLQTDPLADNTVTEIINSGFEKQINEVLMTLVTNDSFTEQSFSHFDSKLSQILTRYFEKSSHLPAWADQKLISAGEKVFVDYGPEIFMLLNVSSLPLCYTCAKGAKVLFDTGRLLTHNGNVDPLARRLMETAQMVMNVMGPGGMSPKGQGIVTIQKVRLIHASIRYYLKNHNKSTWDVAEYGEPINQEDLAGTLMSFSTVILNGLKNLSIELSEKEQHAYSHCWKVIGYMMGIDEKLLPDTYTEGFELATKILKHQSANSEEGKALTSSCVKFLQHIIPGNAFDEIPIYFIAFFLEDFSKSSGIDLAKCIGVADKETAKDRAYFALTQYITGHIGGLEHRKLINKISPFFNKMLLNGIIHHLNGGKAVRFVIPPSLKENWGITDLWENSWSSPAIMGNRISWQTKKQSLN